MASITCVADACTNEDCCKEDTQAKTTTTTEAAVTAATTVTTVISGTVFATTSTESQVDTTTETEPALVSTTTTTSSAVPSSTASTATTPVIRGTTPTATSTSRSTSTRQRTTTTRQQEATTTVTTSSTSERLQDSSSAFDPTSIAEATAAIEADVVRNISAGEKVVLETPSASIVAQRLSLADVVGNNVTITGGEEQAALTVPASLVDQLGGDVAVVFTIFEDKQEQPATQDREAKGGVIKVEGMVSIKMVLPSSDAAHVHGLKDPIVITLPVNVSQGVECAYWDENRSEWLSEGLRTIESSDGGPLTCATTHLTIFGAIWRGIEKTILCSNVDMLSREGIEAVVQTTWYLDRGPQVLGGLTLFMLCLTVFAACLERHRSWRGHRDDAMFFVVVPMLMPDEALGGEIEEVAGTGVRGCCSCVCGWLWACFDPLWQEFVAGLGDIATTIVGLVVELRDALCSEEVRAERGDTPILTFFVLRGLEHAIVSSVLQETAAQLGIGADDVAHVMKKHKEKAAADARDNSAGENEMVEPDRNYTSGDKLKDAAWANDTAPGPSKSLTTMTADSQVLQPQLTDRHLARMDFLEQLYQRVLRAVRSNFDQAGSCCRHPLLVWRLFFIKNPWLSALHFSIFMPSSMAVFILLTLLAGDSALCALFFTATGGTRRRRNFSGNCDIEGVWEEFGQMLLLAIFTAIIAKVPTAMLGACHARDFVKHFDEETEQWRQQLRRWRWRDRFIWFFGILYFMCCLFFCIVFLANVSESDTDNWMQGVLMTVAIEAFVLPLSSALILSMAAWVGLKSASIRRRCEDKLYLDHADLVLTSGGDVKDEQHSLTGTDKAIVIIFVDEPCVLVV
eukprot:TRINITY_DN8540_c0_g3_i1.p1 TRINITY_DN8540_c0_g3~~TRINITY_DN8540_c0_g3_i1.p1  ORF type:complete len:895 (-),score=121.81 TRINITY_DN8540_c0_g3_i1:329-2887(-)